MTARRNHTAEAPRRRLNPRLGAYVEAILKIQVSLAPVLDADVAKRLDQMGALTSVTLGLPVARAYLLDDVVQDAAQIPHGLREMANASLAKTVHVKAVITGSGDPQAEPRWRNFIRRVTTSSALEAFTKLEVHARGTQGDPGQTVDFVKEQLALKETVDLRSAQSRRCPCPRHGVRSRATTPSSPSGATDRRLG
jgi:hypothetical protein